MKAVIFSYPAQALVNRIIPKIKFYENAAPTRAVRDRFVAQISQITWQYKLAPHTVNVSVSAVPLEIEIFNIELKTGNIHHSVLRCIDAAIPHPIFFQLLYDGQAKLITAYKRPSEADASKCVVDAYIESPWCAVDLAPTPLPISLNMAGLYEQMLRKLIPQSARSGESLKNHVERVAQWRSKQLEYTKLEKRLQDEKQFNRKVPLNAKLRDLKVEIDGLAS